MTSQRPDGPQLMPGRISNGRIEASWGTQTGGSAEAGGRTVTPTVEPQQTHLSPEEELLIRKESLRLINRVVQRFSLDSPLHAELSFPNGNITVKRIGTIDPCLLAHYYGEPEESWDIRVGSMEPGFNHKDGPIVVAKSLGTRFHADVETSFKAVESIDEALDDLLSSPQPQGEPLAPQTAKPPDWEVEPKS